MSNRAWLAYMVLLVTSTLAHSVPLKTSTAILFAAALIVMALAPEKRKP